MQAAIAETGADEPAGHGTGDEGGHGQLRRSGRRQARIGARSGRRWAPSAKGRWSSTTQWPPSWPAPRTLFCARSRATLTATSTCAVTCSRWTVTSRGVDAAATVVRELSELIEQGHEIAPGTIEAVTRALDQHESPSEILEDVVWRHRTTKVAPKTVNQKRYVDSIRANTITFGIGPAGTGKTFLAVALAAAALAGARSTASSSPARPSRPASAWASCPAT